ncbi:hypothetical protein [Treponema sp. Marseille-Q4132]|uniref:hypothetical protein n=1 Tax=Treponema sp. Marseille-Q4132 TaxID=2766701 RepID=UPI0016531A62|nr:hypothetical protein [Treponema sp. Marseille-Q4132]QNL98292.1 hypothetical protein H9I35_06020 [Treponema sp. Marseille-Q4132]
MKKIMAIFSVLAAVFVFASCDDVLKEVAPKDTWIAEPIDYKVGSETVSLMCYLYYSDSGTTTPKETIDPGLTIVVRASTDAEAVKLLGSGTAQNYIIKNFPKDSKIDGGSVTINDTLWAGVGIVRNFSKKTTSTPECLSMAGYDKFTGTFNWDGILAKLILESIKK